MAKKRKPGAGRKWFDGLDEKAVLAKLEICWSVDATDNEAAYFAGISPFSLCRYLEAHPAIAQRKAALKERPVLLARMAVVEAFDGHEVNTVVGTGKKAKIVKAPAFKDSKKALEYLERKRKGEFATRSELAGVPEAPLVSLDLGKKIAADPEASALAAQLVEKLSKRKNEKSL
jgi:hypothetical protein